jgi:hypothetical protein
VTVAVLDCDASSLLVAVMVSLPGEAGALKSPLALIVPAFTDQVTAEL